jgi:hypothetical protein
MWRCPDFRLSSVFVSEDRRRIHMATTLLDMQQAWRDYVQNTMVVTVTSTGVPSGQSEFNPGEKVKFDLNVTNGTPTTGIQVHDIRLHLKSDPDTGVFKFIVPASSTGVTAFATVNSTTPLTAADGEQTAMFIEHASLNVLKPGESVPIRGLEVIGKKVGTAALASDVHASLNIDQMFQPNMDGRDARVDLTIRT